MKRLTALTFGIFLAFLAGAQVTTNPTVTGVGTNLATMVTGVLSPANGGTGIANNAAATLTRSGNHALTITTSGTASLNIGTGGTLGTAAYTAATAYATSAQGTTADNAMPKAGGTFTGGVLFTDNSLDIGANGATRPRTGYFGTSVISPTFYGGSGTSSDLELITTTGVGDGTDVIRFKSGNNGAITLGTWSAESLTFGSVTTIVGGPYTVGNSLGIYGGDTSPAVIEIGKTSTTDDSEMAWLAFINHGNSGSAGAGRKQVAGIKALLETTDANADADSGGHLVFMTKSEAGSLIENMRISSAGKVTMPNLDQSSAATTGTVCWTTGTGNLIVDTTTTCLMSSKKYKQNGRPLDIGLASILALKPIAYELRPEFNPKGLGEQIGLYAEDVAKVDSRLVSKEDDGTPHAVRYQQLTAVLVQAIQEQQKRIERLEKAFSAMGNYKAVSNTRH